MLVEVLLTKEKEY